MKILHISDLHIYNPQVSFLKLLLKYGIDKRISGYLNFYLRRKQVFTTSLRQAMLEKLISLDWDYCLITGDITVLGLEEEFKLSREILSPLLYKAPCFLIPGNHDRYTAATLYPDYMQHYFSNELFVNELEEGKLAQLSPQVALLGLHMAMPRPIFYANGILPKTAKEHIKLLKQNQASVKIVAAHYPTFLPDNIKEKPAHALLNKPLLEKYLLDAGINLYLHGHIHKSFTFSPNETLTCVNSGGSFCKTDSQFGGSHLIEIQADNTVNIKKILPFT